MNREQPMIRAGEREYKEYGLFESYFLLDLTLVFL